MTIKSNFQKVYTTTITRAVGPTTQTGVRGTLPVLVPSDANSIWVASNGSDAAAGTQAAPKLTLNGANTALGGALTNIQVFKNGGTGIITVTSSFTLAGTLQCNQGEIGYIQSSNSTIRVITLAAGRSVNGLMFEETIIFTNNTTSACTFANCGFDTGLVTTFNNTTATPNISFTYSYIRTLGDFYVGNDDTLTGVSFTNCLVVFPSQTTGMLLLNEDVTTGNTSAPTFTRCAILGGVAYGVQQSTTIGVTVTFASCALFPRALIQIAGVTGAISITTNYCRNGWVLLVEESTVSTPSSTTHTNTNEAAIGLPPLFVDQQGAIDGDPAGGRLQVTGKSTPNGSGRYFIDSPLIDAGLAGVDVAPWDESTVLVSATYGDTFTLAEEFEPSAMELVVEPINPTITTDTLGNIHPYHDTLRRKFQFTWADNAVIAPDLIRQFVKMLGSKGTKQWYPLDETGDLWDGTGTAIGTFVPSTSTANATLEPFLLTPMLIERNWQGWIIEVTAASVVYEYYIESNSDDTFSMINKQGFTEPAAGNHTFAIRKMTVANEQAPIIFSQKMFTRFLLGGKWRETEEPETTNNYAYVMPSLTLIEVEDDEESV